MALNKIHRFVLVFAALVLLTSCVSASNDEEIRKLLREGDGFLIKGRNHYRDAIAKYSAAVALNPDNANALFRRADLYYMMKENDLSTADLDKLLTVDPEHRQGLNLRAKQYAATGKLLEAAADFEKVARLHSKHKESKKASTAHENAAVLRDVGSQWAGLKQRLDSAKSSEEKIPLARHCVQLLNQVISKFAKDNYEMRFEKAECALAAHDQMTAADEVKFILTRQPNNLRAIAINARSLRALGAIERAKSEVRRCLSLDPEYSLCSKLHKQIKAYVKQSEKVQQAVDSKKWEKAIEAIDEALAMEEEPPNIEQLWRWKCEGYVDLREVQSGLKACQTAITVSGDEKNPAVLDLYLRKADLRILDDDLDGAQEEVRKASDINSNHQSIHEYNEKLNRLRQQAARKDYYKILGVKKTATTAQIHRAFRKLARTKHPDSLRGKDMSEAEREKVRKQFEDINEAKEMLLDEEKRRRYDAGEDVTKPADQQGGHHHHGGFPGGFHFEGGGFPGGGFPGGGGGGGFQFHFG